jgi:DNA-directed RNA polymerase subunit alpha
MRLRAALPFWQPDAIAALDRATRPSTVPPSQLKRSIRPSSYSELQQETEHMPSVADTVIAEVMGKHPDVQTLLSRREPMFREVSSAHDLANRASHWTGSRESQGMFLYLSGDSRKAYRVLEQQASTAAGRTFLALAALDVNQPAKALEAIGKEKGELATYITIRAHIQACEFDKAASVLKAALAAHPANHDIQLLQIELHFRNGQLAKAAAEIEAFIPAHPGHRAGMFLGAIIAQRCGEDDRAVELYERMAHMPPLSVDALLNLGVMYEDVGEFTSAVRCYAAVLREYPNHDRAKLYLKDAEASVDMFYDEDRERREDKRMQVLRTPVSDFELSVRSRNCLQKMKIETLGDLIAKSEQELLQYKNFGETSLLEIKSILASRGLHLGMMREEALKASSIDEALEKSKPKHEGIMAESVDALELSVRARKCMERMNVRSIGELCENTEQALLGAPNFGATSLIEVKRKLAELGLSLKG